MTQINAYLTFKGNCREAMSFYRDCLDGELKIMSVGESPLGAQVPADQHQLVMHADLRKGGLCLLASDLVGDYPFNPGNTVTLMLYCDTEEEIRTYYERLSAGGSVTTPLKVEFWGSIYGDITDKFGLRWMLNCDQKPA